MALISYQTQSPVFIQRPTEMNEGKVFQRI